MPVDGRRRASEDGSGVFALKRQNSVRIANQERNLNEDDVILSNRTPGGSFTKEEEIDETGHVTNQLKELTKQLADFADRNAKEPITNEEMSQLA